MRLAAACRRRRSSERLRSPAEEIQAGHLMDAERLRPGGASTPAAPERGTWIDDQPWRPTRGIWEYLVLPAAPSREVCGGELRWLHPGTGRPYPGRRPSLRLPKPPACRAAPKAPAHWRRLPGEPDRRPCSRSREWADPDSIQAQPAPNADSDWSSPI